MPVELLSVLKSRFTTRDVILLAIIAASLLIIVVGLVMFFIPAFSDYGTLLMAAGQTVAEWTGLILLVLNGTVMKTKYWNYIAVGVFIRIIAVLFTIQHWVGAYELMVTGSVLIQVVYTVRFIRRKHHTMFDVMKYLWIVTWFAAMIFIPHRNWSDAWWVIPAGLFWITIALFLRARLKEKSRYVGSEVGAESKIL
jgi:hypothetical protein